MSRVRSAATTPSTLMRSTPTNTEATEARTWALEAVGEAEAVEEGGLEVALETEVGEECSEEGEEAVALLCRADSEAGEGAGEASVDILEEDMEVTSVILATT